MAKMPKRIALENSPLSEAETLDNLLTEFPFPDERSPSEYYRETDGGHDEKAAAADEDGTHENASLIHPIQLLVYGCPGSGKSHYLQQCAVSANRVITIVFHPETSYADFVGVYRPCPLYGGIEDTYRDEAGQLRRHGEPFITYEFVPGPLLEAYCHAKAHPGHATVLIIEELSRANAALAFGDMLQLLDRSDGTDDRFVGESTYAIQPRPEVTAYLVSKGFLTPADTKIRFPPNLYLWASMNRADQNARQLDTAFLRRWRKRHMSYSARCTYGDTPIEVPQHGLIAWDSLRNAINDKLIDIVPEDKLLGPYFLPRVSLSSREHVADDLLGYLWSDVLKSRARELFTMPTFTAVRDAWVSGSACPIKVLPSE